MNTISDTVVAAGGKTLQSIYRSKIPVISSWARAMLAERSYTRDLVPMAELEMAYSAALDWLTEVRGGKVSGAYLEYGVCTGSSMIALGNALKHRDNVNLRFIGFDSFEGLPENAPDQDNGVWRVGSFMSDQARTEARLRDHGIDAEMVVGWFSDTLKSETQQQLQVQSAPLIMVDCDIYSAAKEALEFSVPYITGPTVIVFDDWHAAGLADMKEGEARAWAEVLADHPDIREVGQISPYNHHSHIVMVDRQG